MQELAPRAQAHSWSMLAGHENKTRSSTIATGYKVWLGYRSLAKTYVVQRIAGAGVTVRVPNAIGGVRTIRAGDVFPEDIATALGKVATLTTSPVKD